MMMAVTADQMATLRAYLEGDHELYQRLLDGLDREKARIGFTALIAAGFFEAVDRRFGENGSAADVIAFVADVRTRYPKLSDVIDPHVAERMIRHALGTGSIADLGDDVVGLHQIALAAALIADEQLDETGLDTFMSEARKIADEWISKEEH